MSRETRNLHHTKATDINIGYGPPNIADGNNGEIRLNSTPTGVKLYMKYNNKWISFSPDNVLNAEIDLNQTISVGYSQSQVQAISDKVDTILMILRQAGIIKESL